MKLYTVEEVIELMYWISPVYMDREDIKIFLENKSTPIELPSDEEIEESETDSPYDRIDEYNYGFIDGANWVKQFMLNQTNQIK